MPKLDTHRKTITHLAVYPIHEVLSHLGPDKKKYVVGDVEYFPRMGSNRLRLFLKSRRCVACGLYGQAMMLDLCKGNKSPHFNLYGVFKGKLQLFTKDHIQPLSRHGEDTFANLQVQCEYCNNLKSNKAITLEEQRAIPAIKIRRRKVRNIGYQKFKISLTVDGLEYEQLKPKKDV